MLIGGVALVPGCSVGCMLIASWEPPSPSFNATLGPHDRQTTQLGTLGSEPHWFTLKAENPAGKDARCHLELRAAGSPTPLFQDDGQGEHEASCSFTTPKDIAKPVELVYATPGDAPGTIIVYPQYESPRTLASTIPYSLAFFVLGVVLFRRGKPKVS